MIILVYDLVHKLVDQWVNRQWFKLGNELVYVNIWIDKRLYK